MPKPKENDPKQRIFNTAVSLFAHKGYASVGIREIARTAGVQISMINYYFQGKIGILKEIMNKCFEQYYQAIHNTGDENTPIQTRVRTLIQQLVAFFRENTEMAIVAFSTLPVDIPEVIDLRIKWLESNREATERLYTQCGLDLKNDVDMVVMRSYLTNIVLGFFESMFCCDQIASLPDLSQRLRNHYIHDKHGIEKADAFFKQYADRLATMYLYGLQGFTGKSLKHKEGV
jgi:AcrR family transcriptional regulator